MTPPLLTALALTAMHDRLGHAGLVILVVGLDVLTGLFTRLMGPEQMGRTIMWFVIGNVFVAAMLWIIWGPFVHRARAHGPGVEHHSKRHAPGLFPSSFNIAAIVILELTVKGVHGIYHTRSTQKLLRERGGGGTPDESHHDSTRSA